jgi:hypothetical protein
MRLCFVPPEPVAPVSFRENRATLERKILIASRGFLAVEMFAVRVSQDVLDGT